MKAFGYVAVLAGALVMGWGCGVAVEGEEGPVAAHLEETGTRHATAQGPGIPIEDKKERVVVSCRNNPNVCYRSPEADCGCRDEPDGICVNAYGQNCVW